ncbi:MAG: hypothetical protein EHM20_08325 [Alphaproteobacteria bacterium]|nr:MAG: hypothetical protein EHM20_12955 [Alphaproteobacteria bacterium]RPJ75824.1 MAG: hypothetical protein EHM20_08325 [Alphaproteobacteria bacterium]
MLLEIKLEMVNLEKVYTVYIDGAYQTLTSDLDEAIAKGNKYKEQAIMKREGLLEPKIIFTEEF